jgi:hypothetical protein
LGAYVIKEIKGRSMRGYERIIELLSTALLIIVGVLGILVAALDLIGTDFNNGPWSWIQGPLPITLLTVALLALALGLERIVRFQQINRQLDTIKNLVEVGPERIIRSLHGVDVKDFDNAHQFYT